ncbi:MAG: hypothetical protein Q8P15_00775, partial [Nanoarchaeota archaeon]|nr:hypothetical protein [Nanoarchaeota archaeon]
RSSVQVDKLKIHFITPPTIVETTPTITSIHLNVFDENNSLVKQTSYSDNISELSEDDVFVFTLNTSDMDKGLYVFEANYSNTLDKVKDKNPFIEEEVREAEINRIRQYFQILE